MWLSSSSCSSSRPCFILSSPPSVSVSLSSPPFAIPGFFVSVCFRCFGGLTTPRSSGLKLSSAFSAFSIFLCLETINFLSNREQEKANNSSLNKLSHKETKTSRKTGTIRRNRVYSPIHLRGSSWLPLQYRLSLLVSNPHPKPRDGGADSSAR